jgi:hypothetical protein
MRPKRAKRINKIMYFVISRIHRSEVLWKIVCIVSRYIEILGPILHHCLLQLVSSHGERFHQISFQVPLHVPYA